MIKVYELADFKHDLELILSIRMTKQDRNIKLATLMTKMEVQFKIPALNSEKFNAENKEIIALYREISNARFD